jgi:hypothetical protein
MEKKNWQKMLAAGLACTAAVGFCFQSSVAEAAYKLNPAVKRCNSGS